MASRLHDTATMPGDDFTERRFVELGPAKICYRATGSGPALVLLHGFPLSGLTWRKVVAALAPRFTCYALDLVGLGDSTSRDAQDFSSGRMAAVFQRALRTLGVESYALVGNDTGGWIARELALLDRERVTHLALTNTEIPGHRPPWIPLYQWLAPLPGSSVVFRRMIASRALRRSPMGFGGCFVNLDLLDGEFGDLFVAPLIASSDRVAALAQFLVQMKFARLDRFRELHRELAMPVAFFWGAADPTFPLERARAMTSQFRNVAGFHPIADAKLFVQEEQPEAVARLAGDFFATAS
ncbi:MAG: alpha/beta hydrolase [Deltaproteobacteria bacterium]|nr:MAG: alpha/beta hydrolase [Deltaproteobacteria bacterium]